ncbi:MAG: glycosyltransferase, partial [Ectothiorhodospiraceae bacterium]
AFAALRREMDARLIILGEGSRRSELEGLARRLGIDGAVDMPGFVRNPAAHVRRANVFALSSAWEGFGNVLVEALAVGTPVVSTDCRSGPSEILDSGRYGDLVPVGDSAALARALAHNLRGPRRHIEPQAIDRFRAEHCAEQYLECMGMLSPA